MSQKYQSGASVRGEKIAIKCDQGGRPLAEASWSTEFRYSIQPFEAGTLLGARVLGEEILVKLLSLSVFQPEDLADLALSPIPEVRIGAGANLTDGALLVNLAKDDRVPGVRAAAVGKLSDQELLAKLANEATDPNIREAAAKKLSDQTVLARLAAQNVDKNVRRAAVEQLNDPASLATVVTTDKEWTARPDHAVAILVRAENIVRAESGTGSLPVPVTAERKRMIGESSDAGVGRAHPNPILAVLEERQHPVGRQAGGVGGIAAVTDKSLAIAIELEQSVLGPYPEREGRSIPARAESGQGRSGAPHLLRSGLYHLAGPRAQFLWSVHPGTVARFWVDS